jgi:sulfofructose kinase
MAANSKKYDVLGLGVVSVDDLLFVDQYPKPDGKAAVQRRERQCGGLTGTALVAAARLGARCAYAGTLGRDALSAYALAGLRAANIDARHVQRVDRARPVHSVIIVDATHHTRNIFYDKRFASGAAPAHPPAAVIRSARVLFVDLRGVDGMIRAAKIARAAGIPVVADFDRETETRFDELYALVDHLIVPERFALRRTKTRTAGAAVKKLREGKEAVVVTRGSKGCVYADKTGVAALPAFKVNVVDTTGCGDVFHGAYAAELARGSGLRERVRIASACAAIKAGHAGGQAGIPRRRQVEKFLRRQEQPE